MVEHLLWLDLETTGLDHTKGEILEVHARPTTMDLKDVLEPNEDGTVGWTYLVATKEDPSTLADAEVAIMHAESGLWEDLNRSGAPIWWIDRDLSERLEALTLGQEIWLAGSGVAQFDIHWIREHMPLTARFLPYRTIDVGHVKRFLRDVVGLGGPVSAKAHRAEADVAEALEMARDFAQRLAMTAPVN